MSRIFWYRRCLSTFFGLFFALRTVWEMKQRHIVDMAVDRGAFIDQSQSLNIHMDTPSFQKLTSLHFYAWSKVSCWLLPVVSVKDCQAVAACSFIATVTYNTCW